jgi:hypothetical protein
VQSTTPYSFLLTPPKGERGEERSATPLSPLGGVRRKRRTKKQPLFSCISFPSCKKEESRRRIFYIKRSINLKYSKLIKL